MSLLWLIFMHIVSKWDSRNFSFSIRNLNEAEVVLEDTPPFQVCASIKSSFLFFVAVQQTDWCLEEQCSDWMIVNRIGVEDDASFGKLFSLFIRKWMVLFSVSGVSWEWEAFSVQTPDRLQRTEFSSRCVDNTETGILKEPLVWIKGHSCNFPRISRWTLSRRNVWSVKHFNLNETFHSSRFPDSEELKQVSWHEGRWRQQSLASNLRDVQNSQLLFSSSAEKLLAAPFDFSFWVRTSTGGCCLRRRLTGCQGSTGAGSFARLPEIGAPCDWFSLRKERRLQSLWCLWVCLSALRSLQLHCHPPLLSLNHIS